MRMLERTSAPLIIIKRFLTKRWRFAPLVNPALKVVYCVERFLFTVIVHIQLPLQLLIRIIGSLMKLSAWEKTQKAL